MDAVAPNVEAKKLRLLTSLAPAAGDVLGDRRRLQQVVTNLLLNAVKFTGEGGTVEVRVVRHETSARLSVRDTGHGIDPALLGKIFDPFEQGDSSTTRSQQGLGLGLAIVRQIVELHGGTIRAESEGEDRGATFTVDLPVLAVRVASDAPATGSARAAGIDGLRVLIVDDQADARDLLALVLADHGADVHTATSAVEALDSLETHDIDVLVSDICMPGTDGYGLIEAVRKRGEVPGRRLHAVAVTAYTGREVRDRALAAGFDAQATKPLDPERLVEILSTVRAA